MSDEVSAASVQRKLLLDGAGEQTAASVQRKLLLDGVGEQTAASVQRKLLLLYADSPRDVASVQRKVLWGPWAFYVVKNGEPVRVKFLGIYDKTANVVKPARYYPVSSFDLFSDLFTETF